MQAPLPLEAAAAANEETDAHPFVLGKFGKLNAIFVAAHDAVVAGPFFLHRGIPLILGPPLAHGVRRKDGLVHKQFEFLSIRMGGGGTTA